MVWSIDQARTTYSLPHWADSYFDINQNGEACVMPLGQKGPSIALKNIVDVARSQGAQLPLLLRFPDILIQRLQSLQAAFERACHDSGYEGQYSAIYPIKVNQHQGVAGTLAADQSECFGLEAGSKPELMAVLALSKPGGLIICNGYKDREYIRLALVGRKLGFNVFIVIEKPSELDRVLDEAHTLGIEPGLGVRVRLSSLGVGKWQNSGGSKAKFGLSARQVLDVWDRLRRTPYAHCFRVLHVHMGSQISNIRDIANGMREVAQYFVELSKLQVPIHYVDVGGGLGVDYEGTRSRSDCSINYSIDAYASHVVQALADACKTHNLNPPHILTESGRAMTAHHAVLITNVIDIEYAPSGQIPTLIEHEPPVIRYLRLIHGELDKRPAVELFYDAQHYHAEGLTAYALGQLSIVQRAQIDDLFYAIAHGVRQRLSYTEKKHRVVLDELNERLVDKFFLNFSVFESMPDDWSIDQIFPIMPIERLNEMPTRYGVIADMTCDSDGLIKQYVHHEQINYALPLHELNQGDSYYIGFFLIGAYQEILGDIHNLFGDTDTMAVQLSSDGYQLTRQHRGDTTDVMLDYVGYNIEKLREIYAQHIADAGLSIDLAQEINKIIESGLNSYTYLADEPLSF